MIMICINTSNFFPVKESWGYLH